MRKEEGNTKYSKKLTTLMINDDLIRKKLTRHQGGEIIRKMSKRSRRRAIKAITPAAASLTELWKEE